MIAAFPGDPNTAPPSYRYFIAMVDRLRNVRPADLTENSVLLGSPAQITDTLKKVEAAGFDEVILYFNVGLKPHAQVKDEMARFMTEVAPASPNLRGRRAACDAFQRLALGFDADSEFGQRRHDHQAGAEEIAVETALRSPEATRVPKSQGATTPPSPCRPHRRKRSPMPWLRSESSR